MARELLPEADLISRKSPSTPCSDEILHLTAPSEDEPIDPIYRSIVGKLGWLVLMTRPDLAFAYSLLSRHSSHGTKHHTECALQVVRYAYKTKDYKITYGPQQVQELHEIITSHSDFCPDVLPNNSIISFTDASHGGEKPMIGGVSFKNGSPFDWRSSRAPFTSLSSCEVEYVAATKMAVDIQWSREVNDFIENKTTTGPTVLFCDNKSAVMLSDNNTSSKRLKHIATRIAFLREKVQNEELVLYHIRTTGQVADIFTKPLGAAIFHPLRILLLG